MKAQVREIDSSDVDLDAEAGRLLRGNEEISIFFLIGVLDDNSPGGDLFQIVVVGDEVGPMRAGDKWPHYVWRPQLTLGEIVDELTRACSPTDPGTWGGLVSALSCIGGWEFSDYQF